jgi:DNA polymerase-3 subunit epsilon
VALAKSYDSTLATHYNRAHAVEELEELCKQFNLCPRFCTLQTHVTECSHYKLKNCKGICKKEESVALYNMRVNKAIAFLKNNKENYAIKQSGRTSEEECFILVKDGDYKGFGFVDKQDTITSLTDLDSFLEPKKASYHTNQILKSFLRTHGKQALMHNANPTST